MTASRKPLAAVHGTTKLVCRLSATCNVIAINGAEYLAVRHETGYQLHGKRGVYDLPKDLSSCDCADATFRSERPGGCKHRRALAALKAARKIG